MVDFLAGLLWGLLGLPIVAPLGAFLLVCVLLPFFFQTDGHQWSLVNPRTLLLIGYFPFFLMGLISATGGTGSQHIAFGLGLLIGSGSSFALLWEFIDRRRKHS
jgi:hypothetical protein